MQNLGEPTAFPPTLADERLKALRAVLVVAVTVLAFFNCVRLFWSEMFKTLMGSYDSGWIIRTGSYILENGQIPAHDIYSWTSPDRVYTVYQWLFAAVAAGFYQLGGLWLVGLACCLTAGIYYFLILPRMWTSRGVPWLLSLFFLSFVLSAHWFEIRPQIVSFGLILGCVAILERWRVSKQSKGIYWLPALMALWANVHLFWSIGLTAVAVYWVSDCVRTRSASRSLLLVFGACLLALLVNPYGFGLIKYWWSFVDHSQWMQVCETSSPFGSKECQAQLFYLAITGGMLFKLRHSVPREGLILSTIIGLSALSVQRMLTPTVFVSWPFLGMALASVPWPDWMRPKSLSSLLPGCGLPGSGGNISTLAAATTAAVCLTVGLWMTHYPTSRLAENDFYSSTQPMLNLVEHTVTPSDHLFNDPAVGSWMILRKSCPVMIDTRYDMYDRHFCEDFISCLSGMPGWDSYLDRMKIDYMLIRNECTNLRGKLSTSGGWQLVKTDGRLSFWRRATPTQRLKANAGEPLKP